MRIDVDRLLKLIDRRVILSVVGKFFAATDEHRDMKVARHAKYPLSGIDEDCLWLPFGLHVQITGRTDDFYAGVFRLAIGLDLKFDRHLERIEILFNGPVDAISIFLTPDGVVDFELRDARTI